MKYCVLATLCLAVVVGGFGAYEESNQPAASEDVVSRLVRQLRSEDRKVRDAADKTLRGFTRTGFSKREAEFVLAEAAKPFPKPDKGENEACRALLNAASEKPYDSLVPLVEQYFQSYTDDGRYYALVILFRKNSEISIDTFLRLLEKYEDRITLLPLNVLKDQPRHSKKLFPALLRYGQNPAHGFDIYKLCLDWCEAGYLRKEQLAGASQQLVDYTRTLLSKLERQQNLLGKPEMWVDSYTEIRSQASLQLDLLGYFPKQHTISVLQKGLQLKDPRIKYFASSSLLHNGETVSAADLLVIAAIPETRNLLYDKLVSLKLESQFPEQFRTQEAFAESDMITWLIYPTELGRAPDAINLMKVYTVTKDQTEYDYYLFKFRDGKKWVAGVAGPYNRLMSPTTNAEGGTFSQFREWDSQSLDDHIAEIAGTLEKWNKLAE